VATNVDGDVITRNFTLLIGNYPPAVDQPTVTSKGSTWIQISWQPVDCNGGYEVASYNVEYKLRWSYTYTLGASVTQLNYTIHNLIPDTEYNIRVSTISYASTGTTPSLIVSVITLEQGPSPPRGVVVTVSYNSEVCATWRFPATPVGEVILYKLYAEIVDSSADIVDAIDLPTETQIKV
jgi:hypothetical protein